MTTTRLRVLTVVTVALGMTGISALAQSPHELFQQALVRERTGGNCQQVIPVYERVMQAAASDRALAARALVQIAGCYERLGQTAKAKAQYQQVVASYGDQPDSVTTARARLQVLAAGSAGGRGAGPGAVPDASPLVELTKAPDLPLEPVKLWAGTISPNGRYVVTGNMSDEGRWASPFRNLFVRDLTTDETRILDGNRFGWSGERPGDLVKVDAVAPGTGPPATGEITVIHNFIWSPDSRRVLYLKGYQDRAAATQESELRVINIDGTGSRVILPRSREGWPRLLDWSADGRYVAVSDESDVYSLGILSMADGSIRTLKTFTEAEFYWCQLTSAFSPDGRFLAVTNGTRNSSCDVALVATDGSGERTLIEHPANDEFVAWTPDGKGLLFTSDRSGTVDLWLVRVDDGRVEGLPQRVRANTGRMWTRGLTASGDLYFQTPGIQRMSNDGCCDLGVTVNDVYVAPLDPATGDLAGQPAAVAPTNRGRNHSPSWSPDGRFLMYRTRDIRAKTWTGFTLLSLETGEERGIRPDITVGLAQREGWLAPDNQSVVIATIRADAGLYRVDAGTGAASPLGALHGEVTVLRNREAAVLVPDRSSVVVRQFDTGEERTVYTAPSASQVRGLAASADSRNIAFQLVANGSASFWVVPAAGGEARQIAKLRANSRNGQFMAWSADGRFIYFVDRPVQNNDKDELWRATVADGTLVKLLAVDGPIWNPDVHPSGRYIAFASEHFEPPTEWVLRHFLPAAPAAPVPGGGR
jgi:Tol biopolymer transport system component